MSTTLNIIIVNGKEILIHVGLDKLCIKLDLIKLLSGLITVNCNASLHPIKLCPALVMSC